VPTSRHTAVHRERTPRHQRLGRRRRVARTVAVVTLGVLVFGVTAAGAVVHRMFGNMRTADVTGLVDIPKPTPTGPVDPDDPHAGQPVNILVLGSDQRDGENGTIGGVVDGRRSDTTLVVHVSADRQRVEVVSIPRDSLVEIPDCERADGSTRRGSSLTMFNEAFARPWVGDEGLEHAVACTIRTIHANTGLLVDHHVVVDFSGFQDMVDAVGGVPICIPWRMKATDADLDVQPGEQRLDGPTALAFARARKGVGLGDNSDINRIGNQQRLVAAMADEVLTKNLLTDVPELLGFFGAATSSLTVDPEFRTGMLGLAYHLRSLRGDGITFMTVPWAPAASDEDKVEWTSAADDLWANVVADRPALGGPAVPDVPAGDSPAGDSPAGDDVAAGAGGTVPPTTTGDAPTPTSSATPAAPPAPTPAATRKAGREPFSVADTTAVCG